MVGGLAATLILVRDRKTLLWGFFNSPLKKAKPLWLPCAVEALAIASAVTYLDMPFTDFASRHPIVCTDNACQVCKFVQELAE